MKKVNITVYDRFLVERLRANDKPLSFEKVEKNKYVAEVETEEDQLQLSMFAFHHLLVEHWWIKEMILFIVGIFGIFNPHEPKNDVVFNYKSKVKLTEETTELTVRRGFVDKAIEVKGGETIDEANERVHQPLIAKRRKALKWSKVGVVLGVLLIAIIVIILLIIFS